MKEMTSMDWFITGDQDESWDHSLQLSSLLQPKGIPCKEEEKPGEGHWCPAQFHKSLNRGLAFILGGTGDAG